MKFKKYMKGYWVRTFSGAFFKLVEAFFELLLPFFMSFVIDEGIKKGDTNVIVKMSILMLTLTIFGYLSSLTCQYFASVVAQHFGFGLRNAISKKINSFTFSELDNFSSSTLTNRLMNDADKVQWGVALTIRLAIRVPFLMFGSFAMIYTMDKELAMILAMFSPLFIIVIGGLMYLSMKIFRKSQTQLDKVSHVVQDYLHGVRIIRSFAKDEHERERFEQKNNRLNKLLIKMGTINSLSNPLTTIVMNLALVIMMYMGILQARDGISTQGQLIAIINYCSQLLMAFIMFVNLVIMYSRAFSAKKRIEEVLDTSIAMEDKKDSKLVDDISDITFNDVSFYYPNQKYPSLKNISFQITNNQTIGVVGRTGSGKSTLLQTIARFYDVQEGSYILNNTDIKDYNTHSLYDHIGYVSQKSVLLSGTIKENLAMGNSYSDQEIDEALKVAQAFDFVDEKGGVTQRVEQGGSNFSGGQKQRLHLARAIIKKPPLLLLDDTFSALDFATDRNLRHALKEYQKNQICIIASQRISSIMQADTIFVLDKGEIIDRGTHEELLTSCQLYKDLYDSQTQEVSYV